MNKLAFLKAALLISFVGQAPVCAQKSDRPDGMRFLPDVPGQFSALNIGADPLGMHRSSSPNPSSCKHYQGVVRVQGADGTPFLLVSRSGNLPDFVGSGTGCNDSPGETDNGHLIVFRMGSRDKFGERLRSNRLRKGVHVDDTPPNLDDKATIYFTVADGGLVLGDGGGSVPRRYGHPGGMQVVGNVLALAVEHRSDSASPETLVMFLDVSNPEDPLFLSQFALVDGDEQPRQVAGTVGITPLPDGHYLMMVTGGEHNPSLWFYRSTSTDLKSADLSWLYVDGWHADTSRSGANYSTCAEDSVVGANGFCLSPDEQYLEQNWPDGNDGHTHQTLQFLREGNIDGTLYLAGVRGKYGSDTSKIDLYRIDCETSACNGGQIKMKRSISRDLAPIPSSGGRKLASFAAASSFYISPSGELLLYVTEHDNDGPDETVMAGEWRHKDVVREDSPTLLPTAVLNGPYEVDEGSMVELSGSARAPITKAWIQLFHETYLRSASVIVDFDDYDLDDYDDFYKLEYPAPFTHKDKARSWNWFAPVGCSILATDRDEDTVDETKTLFGVGRLQYDPELAAVLNDDGTLGIDREIDKVEFLQNCRDYYATPFVLEWDLDGNGSYETTGSPVTLNTSAFDGPSNVAIPAQARHPAGGPVGPAIAKVTVRNVAPQLTPLRVTDSTGHEINAQVPFVLTGLPITVSSSFSDPGVLDHQSATLVWGDGGVETQTAFTSFDEAFGDATGSASHTHRYALAGSYPIALSVTDDDGGVGVASAVVRVVTPEQAVEEIIRMLDVVIAGTTNDSVRKELEKARKALAGSNEHSNNGALEKIRDGNEQAAIAFLRQAIDRLRRAESGGAGVATHIALLEQVVAALSAS